MSEQLEILRGKEASMILESEAFRIAMERLKEAIDAKRNEVSVRDPQGLVIAALWERIHRDFKSVLVGLVQNGEFAERQIEIDKFRNESKPKQMLRKVVGY